jgi:hypothetical protein
MLHYQYVHHDIDPDRAKDRGSRLVPAVLGLVIALAGIGCASGNETREGVERDFSGFARRANPSLRVGDARVVDARIYPTLRLRTGQASRVELEGARFVVCWTRGTIEGGRRALAQAFKANGTPLGAPVAISPANLDVVGPPQVIATAGQHVVARFAAASANSTEIFAVPLFVMPMKTTSQRRVHETSGYENPGLLDSRKSNGGGRTEVEAEAYLRELALHAVAADGQVKAIADTP